jgi:threonylcarbamoyladenosine tRNA methylthiotransferase MtaB
MKVYLVALGCKLNQSETEDWARHLTALGCKIIKDPAKADLCIVNTCTVTHVAARKSRNLARRCARANPRAQVVLTGCYAEISPEEAAQLPGVSLVLGTAGKERLVASVAQRFGLSPASQGVITLPVSSLHTRAFVKIQDGCDNACTYCIVRIARGRQRSRPMRAVLDEVLARQAEGYQEIVLTGVHIGAYGRERGETLAELVSAILRETRFPRLRLSSIEPWDLTPDLLHLWENPRLCRHLHLPLQSGCDATLLRMNRRYTTAHYRDLLRNARAAIPDLAATTDVIVGFPGEDEREFEASAEFVAEMGFARVHVFPFSARPGTAAAAMPEQIPPHIKETRGERMRAIARQSAVAFQRGFLGRTMDVLWETREGQRWSGLTDNYIRVKVTSSQKLHNRILPTRLLELAGGSVHGELVSIEHVSPFDRLLIL